MKIIFLISTFFLEFTAQSQNLTEKDIQGKWILTKYNTTNASLDIKTGKVTLEKSAFTFGDDTANKLKNDMESYAEQLKTAYVEIDGNNFTQLISDAILVGTYTIESKEGYQVLSAKFDNGNSGSMHIMLKNGLLTLSHPGRGKTYVYKKS